MEPDHIPDLAHLERAYARTAQATRRTPVIDAPALAEAIGASRVLVKPESLQWTGSFKVRGAYWRLTQLSPEEAARGVVAYSSGNFAQGLAAAGKALGIPVTVVTPIDAPLAKREAAAGYGARVVTTEHGDRPREEVALEKAIEIAETEGLARLHPFDDPDIVAGQAGVALEAISQLDEEGLTADMVICPIGGGGLMGGVSLAFHYARPGTDLVGVEMEGFDGMRASLANGAIETRPLVGPSICDGLMARRPGVACFAAACEAGLRVVTTDDTAVRPAMKHAFECLKLVLEPSGASAIAALQSGKVDAKGKTVLVISTGGNIAYDDFARHVGHA